MSMPLPECTIVCFKDGHIEMIEHVDISSRDVFMSRMKESPYAVAMLSHDARSLGISFTPGGNISSKQDRELIARIAHGYKS